MRDAGVHGQKPSIVVSIFSIIPPIYYIVASSLPNFGLGEVVRLGRWTNCLVDDILLDQGQRGMYILRTMTASGSYVLQKTCLMSGLFSNDSNNSWVRVGQ